MDRAKQAEEHRKLLEGDYKLSLPTRAERANRCENRERSGIHRRPTAFDQCKARSRDEAWRRIPSLSSSDPVPGHGIHL